MTNDINISVNGEDRDIPAGLTVEALLKHLDLQPGMIVVERNGEILRREGYAGARLGPGDRLELVHFVGGG